ncbi:MAG: hypothetical protein HY453_00135 [Parcubacteria group bacterium]|nr:hypothetical protein [Parcubacteria group bacterium]
METGILEAWAIVLTSSFQEIWLAFIKFLPNFLGAVIIFVIGWFIAGFVGNFIKKIVEALKIDELIENVGLKESFIKAGIKLNVAILLGWIAKWLLVIVFLVASADILQWQQINEFLSSIVDFIANVFIAVIILLAGILLGNFMFQIVYKSVSAAELRSAKLLAGLAKWAVVVFAAMAALVQLDIAQHFIATLYTGFIAMVALAAGLAFGLGGREHAKEVIELLKKDISEHGK